MDFIPQLSNEVEFFLGDKVRDGVDNRLIWLVTFIKPNVAIEAKKLGIYLKRQVGDTTGLDLRIDIKVYDPFWTVEPETPGASKEVTTLTSNVSLSGLVGQPNGWKAIDIVPFAFEANRTYVILFKIVSQALITNGQDDAFVISGAQKFDIPIIPPDYPFPENQCQAKNAYGIERESFGWVYTFPVAIALYGEAAPPAPIEKGIITNVTAPSSALEGEKVPITITVKNIGEIATNFSVFFYKKGHGIQEPIELGAGQSGTVSINYTMPAENMAVEINLTHADIVDDTKSLVVYLGGQPQLTPKTSLLAPIIIGLGIIVAFFLLKKR